MSKHTKVWETIHILANEHVDRRTIPGYIIVDAYNYNPYTLETWRHNETNIMIHPSQNEKGIGGTLAGYMDSTKVPGKRALIIKNTKEMNPPAQWDARFRHHVERVDEKNLYRVKVFIFKNGQCFVNNRQHYLNVGSDSWSEGDIVSYGSVENQEIISIKTFAESLPTKLEGEKFRREAIELCKKVGLKPINSEAALKAKETEAVLEVA